MTNTRLLNPIEVVAVLLVERNIVPSAGTGVYLDGDNTIGFLANGAQIFSMNGSVLFGKATNAPALYNRSATATVPTLIPSDADYFAGLGANAAGNVSVIADNAGAGVEVARATSTGFFTNIAAFMMRSIATITGGSMANAPTLTAGPVNGNPTKWLPYDDNGTTRYIPSW